MNREAFSKNLKAARKAQNKTQKQVADEVGIAVNTYACYERNIKKPSLHTLASLCLALEVSAEQLLSDGDYKPFLSEAKREHLRTMDKKKLSLILDILQAIYKNQKDDW